MPYKLKTKNGKFCVVNKETGKEVNCHADKPKALRQLRAVATNEKAELTVDAAAEYRFPCYEEDCERAFLDYDVMESHAARVHVHEKTVERAEALLTFDDTRKIVHEYIRETFGRQGDYKATPVVPSIWTWIEDMATDWVVYTVENGNDTTLYKASYSITDGAVNLGEPSEVRRRTVYEPVKKDDD